MILKVDKDGNILKSDGKVFGAPIKTGRVYRGSGVVGCIDWETGTVFDNKNREIGKVEDVTVFECYAKRTSPKKTKKFLETHSATEPKKTKKKGSDKEPKETVVEVVESIPVSPGYDSAKIVSGELSKELYGTQLYTSLDDRLLEEVNKKYKWKYKNWEELSEKEDLSDDFLDKYDSQVSWYHFLLTHPDRQFSGKYSKKFKGHLMMRTLGLVPYNGKIVREKDYVPSSIKADREKAKQKKDKYKDNIN